MRAIVFCALFGVLCFPLAAYGASSSVGFSQIKTRGLAAGDEAIELFNPTDASVELNGYKIVKTTASGSAYSLSTLGQGVILPHSYVLFALEGGAFAALADKTYKTALADNNTLFLYDAAGSVVDSLAWGDGQTLANHATDQSYQRSWQEAAASWSPWTISTFTQFRTSGDSPPVEVDQVVDTQSMGVQTDTPPFHVEEIQLQVPTTDRAWMEIVIDTAQSLDGWALFVDGQSFATLSGLYPLQTRLVISSSSLLSTNAHEISLRKDSSMIGPSLSYPTNDDTARSYALIGGEWDWTWMPTAGRPNVASVNVPLTCAAPVPSEPAPAETASPSLTNPPANASLPQIRNDGRLRINEVFANPSGDEATGEFVELFNPESYDLSTHGWKIADATKSSPLPDLVVPAGGWLVLHRAQTTLSLNNGAETVSLFNSSDQLIASITYDAAKEDLSWNAGNPWYEAAPTPGGENTPAVTVSSPTNTSSPPADAPQMNHTAAPTQPAPVLDPSPPPTAPDPVDPVIETATSSKEISTPPPAAATTATKKASNIVPVKETTFAAWPKVSANSKVTIVGMLIATPGVFGEKTATIQDVTGAYPGIELYFSGADWPAMSEGDIVQAIGKKSSAKSGDRLLISSAEDLAVLDTVSPDPADLPIEALTIKRHRTLARIQARIIQNKAGVLTVADDTHELSVNIKKAGIEPTLEHLPVEAILTGVVIYGKNSELWLRSADDIEIVESMPVTAEQHAQTASPAPLSDHSTTITNPTTLAQSNQVPETSPWLAPLAAAGSAGGLSWYFFQDALKKGATEVITRLRSISR